MGNERTEGASKLWTPSFGMICLLNMVLFLGFHMLISTFPFYVLHLGGDEVLAGLTTSLFSVSALAARPIIGRLLDRKGRRIIMCVGLCGMALLPLGYIALPIIACMLGLRLLHGLAWSCASTSVNTVVCDMLPRQRFGEGMGYFGLTAALSTAVAPALGLALMERAGFTTLFAISTCCSLLALLCQTRLSIAETPPAAPTRGVLHDLPSLFNKDALPAAFTTLLFMMSYGALTTFIALFAEADGLPSGGLFFTVLAVSILPARLLIGKLVDRRGEGGIVVGSAASMFVALNLLAWTPGPITFFIAAALYGAAFGALTPSMQTMAMRLATPQRRGSASSTYLCCFDLGIALGSFTAGLVVKSGGYAQMFFLASFCAVAALAFYLLLARRHPSSFGYEKRHGRV